MRTPKVSDCDVDAELSIPVSLTDLLLVDDREIVTERDARGCDRVPLVEALRTAESVRCD